jgi:hypothetical protein
LEQGIFLAARLRNVGRLCNQIHKPFISNLIDLILNTRYGRRYLSQLVFVDFPAESCGDIWMIAGEAVGAGLSVIAAAL